MDGFTITDGVALVVVAISALLAYSRGLVREVMAILAWVVAAIAAFYFAPQAVPLIREIPYVREFIATSCELSMAAAFAAVFAVALVVLSIFTPLFAAAVQESALGPIDRGFGFLFGVARGALLVIVALLVVELFRLDIPEIARSRTAALLADAQARLRNELPTELPGWVDSRYNEFFGECLGLSPRAPAPAAPAPAPANT